MPATRPTEVSAKDQNPRVPIALCESLAGLASHLRIVVSRHDPIGHGKLNGVMHHVASDHGLLFTRPHQHAGMAWCMSGCGFQSDLACDLVVAVHQVRQPRIHDWLDRAANGKSLAWRSACPKIILLTAKQISGLRESRHPLPAFQDGVPAHVVKMEVRAYHRVNVVSAVACLG